MKNPILPKLSFLSQALLMFFWASNYTVKTDGLFGVYLLCVFLGIYAFAKHKGSLACTDPRQGRIVAICAALFALSGILANIHLLPLSISTPFFFAGAFFLGFHSIQFLFTKLASAQADNSLMVDKPRKIFLFSFFGLLAWYSIYLFLSNYPGNFFLDSFVQFGQIIQGIKRNDHPFYHTWLLSLVILPVYALTESYSLALGLLSFIQLVFISAVFALCILTLYQKKLSKVWLWGVFLSFALLPYHIAFSINLGKDTPFSVMVLLFVVSAYRLLKGVGKIQVLNLLLFIFSVPGVTLLRNNGVIIVIVLLPLFILFFAKKQKLLCVVFLTSSILALFLRFPMLNILQVEKGRITESLSLPVQQVARTYIFHPESFSEEDKALISELIPLEKIESTYQSHINDPIKFIIQNHHTFIEENLRSFRNLWIKLGLKQPLSYLKAWIELTRGYWHGGYSYWRWDYDIHEGKNVLGLVTSPAVPALYNAYDKYLTMYETSLFLAPLLAIGLHVWLLCILFAYHIWKKNKVVIFLCLAPLLVILSLWLGTPVHAEFRYAYCVFTTLPFLLGLSVAENTKI